MKWLKRHLFSWLVIVLVLVTLFSWWHSTRVWSSFDAETPVGIFKLRNESSLCGFVVQFMNHDHRWAVVSHPDDITGDKMRFLMRFPSAQFGSDGFFVTLPHWQLILLLIAVAGGIFYLERRRWKRRQ